MTGQAATVFLLPDISTIVVRCTLRRLLFLPLTVARGRGLAARLTLALALCSMSATPVQASTDPSEAPASSGLSPAVAAYEAGLDARARGDMPRAALYFEQALLYDTDFAGAWYDYGLALCDLGDSVGCRNLLDEAVRRFGLPPALRHARALRAHTGELRLGLGASTNLSRSTGAQYLTLLLDGVPVEALLDPSFRERGSGFVEAGLRWESRWPLHDVTARLELNARKPFSSALPDFKAGYGELGFGIRPRMDVGVLALGVDEGYLGAIGSVGVWAEHRLAPQGVALRGTLERRNPRGQSGWTTARLLARVPLRQETALHAGWEYDFPQAARAGRAQQRLLLDVRSHMALPALAGRIPRLTLGAGVLHARDSDAYSPLFGDARSRRTRWHLSADLGVNLNRDWRMNLGLSAARQRANIGLFDYREAAAVFSVSYLFH